MNSEKIVSKSGLQTLLVDSPSSNMTSLQFWFKAGSSLESHKNQGIAHFLEHMFFKGSKKFPNMGIAKTVESFGGEINAFTSFDYTCYYINAPKGKALKSLEILLDMVCHPLFLSDDLEPERGVVFEEYLRSIDNPSQFNFLNIQKTSFPRGYSHPILGSEKTIKSFNLEQLKSFRSRFYSNKNALLIVAGSLGSKTKIKTLINSYRLPPGEISQFPKFHLKSSPTINIHQKPVNQSVITFVIDAPAFAHPKAATEDLSLNALTFGDLSPLYKYFVEETSMANGISGSTMFFANGGTHFLRLSCPPENLEKILKELPKKITEAIRNDFMPEDLDRIRNQYLASKIYEKESIESYAFSLGHGFAQNGDIHSDDKYIDSMKLVQASDLQTSLIEIFKRNIHATVQLPEKKSVSKLNIKIEKCLSGIKTQLISKNSNIIKKTTRSEFDKSVCSVNITPRIKLVHRYNPLSETFALHCFIKGGLTEENNKNNGIYNLLAKNITFGYDAIAYDQLKKDLEHKASYLNGFSGRNAYGITLQGLSRFTKPLLDHFFGTLVNPSFPEDKFLIEKELIKRTLHIQKEDPVKRCFQEFSRLVFNGHPYHMDMIGSDGSLNNITVDKIRTLHQRNLDCKNMVITYCGSQPLDEIFQAIKARVKSLQNKKPSSRAKNALKPLLNQKIDLPFEREQTHLMLGKSAFKSNTKQDAYLKIFTTLLSGQSSELFMEVRDKKGLCYSVQPLHNSSLEAGYWGIYMGTSPEKYEQATAALFELIGKYQTKGLSKKEFNLVKQMIYGQNMMSIQTNDDYAYFYSVPVLHGLGLDFPFKTLETIKQIDLDDLNLFLRKFLKGGWNIVKAGS